MKPRNAGSAWPGPEYRIRVSFRAPIDFVFAWCTDYTPGDAALEKETYQRKIIERTPRAGRLDVLHRDQFVDDAVQVQAVRRADQDDIVHVADEEVDGPDARDPGQGPAQPLVRSRVVFRTNEAHREDVVSEFHRVDDRPVAFNHTLVLEPLDPVVDRRRGKPRHPGEVAQADLIVLLELGQDDAVRRFDVLKRRGPLRLLPGGGEGHLISPPRTVRTTGRRSGCVENPPRA